MLPNAWGALSWLAIVVGVVVAVGAPNGFPGVLCALLGLFLLWGWIEHEEADE